MTHGFGMRVMAAYGYGCLRRWKSCMHTLLEKGRH